ncbi:MAG: 16S rRNA (cytidine(1402)-2'-O)-methyltransferase [Christensenellales bacterium]|jgi:16S rRNA (cytidine1402-2'-O)-methyltransferase
MEPSQRGKLILCATPIGNLGDITLRVIEALKNCDMVAAEDTRHSGRLLRHLEISRPMLSYHEHNRQSAGEKILSMLEEGKVIALVTDAGTPGISDPGMQVAAEAKEAGFAVEVLPGPSAVTMALTVSGMDTGRFVFEGFLPAKGQERELRLMELRGEKRTMVLYEAPHRLLRTLEDLKGVLGGQRQMALCRELTKLHEQVMRLCIDEMVEHYREHEPRGEMVLVIEGEKEEASDADAHRVIRDLLDRGLGTRASAKEAARLLQISAGEAYRMALDILNEDGGP